MDLNEDHQFVDLKVGILMGNFTKNNIFFKVIHCNIYMRRVCYYHSLSLSLFFFFFFFFFFLVVNAISVPRHLGLGSNFKELMRSPKDGFRPGLVKI